MFVWLYNVNRFGHLKENENVSHLQRISKRNPVIILYYFCCTLALTFIFYGGLNTGLELISSSSGIVLSNIIIIGYQTVNFHHYVVDGLIWKARNTKNQKAMNIN